MSHTSAQRLLASQLELARELQLAILPDSFPDVRNSSGAAKMIPALEVGGDFYDVFELSDGRLGIVIGDVSGKGVPAAFFMAIARTLIRNVAIARSDPGQCLAEANRQLCAQNPMLLFVTVIYAIWDPWSCALEVAVAGHEDPLLRTAEGDLCAVPVKSSPALGIIKDLEYPVTVMRMNAGDTLLLYTDGFTDALDAQGEAFGSDRLKRVFEGGASSNATETLDMLVASVQAHAGATPQTDDITAVVLQVAPDAAALL